MLTGILVTLHLVRVICVLFLSSDVHITVVMRYTQLGHMPWSLPRQFSKFTAAHQSIPQPARVHSIT